MIASMDRIEIVFLRSELADMVPFLQDQGVLHIEDVPLALENHPGYLHRVTLDEAQRTELAALDALDRLLKECEPLLPAPPPHAAIVAAGPGVQKESLEQWGGKVRQWHRTLRSIARRRLNIQDNIDTIRAYWDTLSAISPVLAVRNVQFGDNARVLVLDGFTGDGVKELERRYLREVGQDAAFYCEPLGKDRHVAVLSFPPKKADAVGAMLHAEGIRLLESPDRSIAGKTIGEVLSNIQARIAQLEAGRNAVAAELEAFAAANGASLVALGQLAASRLARLQVVDKFAQSKMIGVVHGWLPAAAYDGLVSKLKTRFGARAVAAKLGMHDVEVTRIPTLLNNHPRLKPFQLLLGIFNPPTYGTLDPTVLVAVSFTLFYGFILGDIGYGLFLYLVARWAKKKYGYNETVSDAMTIAQYMGMSAMAWGVVYMEFFGDIPGHVFGLHALIHRAGHHQMLALGMAIFMGAVHVPLALVLGIREGYRHAAHDPSHRHHAEEKLGMLLGLVALAIAVASVGGYLPAFIGGTLAALLFAVGFFYLVKSMGAMAPMGLIEILGLTANVLSYGRLMALGIAGVALADLANAIVYSTAGSAMMLIGIPLAGAIHLLNIGIGVFSPTIHSARLNYVEFLPKFYEPEGRNFTPFGKGVAW